MSKPVLIRDAKPSDETNWRKLWAGYNAFYETNVAEEITARTWQSILANDPSFLGRVAEVDGVVVGFSTSILHRGTWMPGLICYLEDLFVDPAYRGFGVGRELINDLLTQAKEQKWSSLYWHTHRGNPARKLYDQFTKADDFVRYRLIFGFTDNGVKEV